MNAPAVKRRRERRSPLGRLQQLTVTPVEAFPRCDLSNTRVGILARTPKRLVGHGGQRNIISIAFPRSFNGSTSPAGFRRVFFDALPAGKLARSASKIVVLAPLASRSS